MAAGYILPVAENPRTGAAVDSNLVSKPQSEEGWELSAKHNALVNDTCDWGALLGSVPQALSHTAQCFIVASAPIAASIGFSGNTDLKYNSLRANLVYCSGLGRDAFRDAELKMIRVQNYALGTCRPNGTINKLLKAVEDEFLDENELRRYLEQLQRISRTCIKDANEIKDKFKKWEEYTRRISEACAEEDLVVDGRDKELTNQSDRKQAEVTATEQQVEASKSHVADLERTVKHESSAVEDSAKALNRGTKSDLGVGIVQTITSTASYLIKGYFIWGSKKEENAVRHQNTRAHRVAVHQRNQELLAKAQEELSKRKDAEIKARKDFEEIQMELQGLRREKVTIEEVRRIIWRCTNSLRRLGDHIGDLCAFFGSIQEFIRYIDEMHVENVAITLESASSSLDKRTAEGREEQKQSMRQDILELRAKLQAAQWMAGAYIEISAKHIVPGIKQITAMSVVTDNEKWSAEVLRKVAQLEQYANEARKDITKFAENQQDEIRSQILREQRLVEEV